MNKKIKKQWVAALRSGEYKQGHDRLSHGGRYCCLGVLTDLAVKAGVCSRRKAFKGNDLLNDEIQEWAGLPNANPVVRGSTLISLNDYHKMPFKDIAEAISSDKKI